MIGSYIERLGAGEDISRPREAVIAERDRVTDEHRSQLSPKSRQAYDKGLELARTVFPFIESHNFYVEHWFCTIFWNKVREFGALLGRYGFVADAEDVFYLRHEEVRSALEEVRWSWSSGGAGTARGPSYRPPIVARRKSIYAAMCQWAPPSVLGRVPETITDPVTIMLWGITTDRIEEWLTSSGDHSAVLDGLPGSPGVVDALAAAFGH
jgi:pyruvate,water dikinase